MPQKGDVFAFVDQVEMEVLDDIVSRQILTYNDEIMMVRVLFKKPGPGGVPHSHPHVQVTSVESGVFDITIDGKTARLKAGDSFYVPSDVHHGAICVEPGVLVDVFTPMRQEFVAG
ncbi:cupin domain-containing protein [Azorhizobium doebereinerae]|uniref:cupin domain-containing protein n=1 Tax=Azorhizobium doebereinerae TaxID=281091 RepID=UPI000407D251|nr:cupin domain-containing protein [Azorhizobium doebereinerae]